MRRAFVLFALLLASRADAADTWTYASSDHFEVYTTSGAGTARQSLAYFERIHAFFAQALKLQPVQKVPTRLIIFSNDKQFAPYRPNAGVAAFYQSGADRDYIVMGRFDGESNNIVAHEYMHLIIKYSQSQFPLWLNEGLAEFFSTVSAEGRNMIVGKVPEERLYYLRSGVALIDLRRLFAVGHGSPEYNGSAHAGVFYSESWALTHMLVTDGRYRNSLNAFLDAMAKGMNTVDALAKVYGKTPENVYGDLRNYIEQSQYLGRKYDYKATADAKYETRAVGQFDADLVTTNLMANSPTGEEAARAAFMKLETQQPNDVAMLESRAYFEMYRGDRAAALPYFERAVAQNTRSVKLMMDYARLDPSKAGALVEKALEIAPDNADVRLEHARQLLSDGEAAQAVLSFKNIKALDRQQWFEAGQILANAYMQLNQLTDARDAATIVADYAEEGSQAAFAKRLAASIEDYARQRAAFEQRARDAASAAGRPASPDAANAVRPPLMTSAASSASPSIVMVAGRIRNIACKNGDTTIELLAGGQTLRLFIDDGKAINVLGTPDGTVTLTCGPKDEKVTIGYKPGVDPAQKTDGYVRVLDYR